MFIFENTASRSCNAFEEATLGTEAVAIAEDITIGRVVKTIYFPVYWPYILSIWVCVKAWEALRQLLIMAVSIKPDMLNTAVPNMIGQAVFKMAVIIS